MANVAFSQSARKLTLVSGRLSAASFGYGVLPLHPANKMLD